VKVTCDGRFFLPSPRWGEGGEPSGLAFGKPKGELREPDEGYSEPDYWLREPLTPALSLPGRGGAGACHERH